MRNRRGNRWILLLAALLASLSAGCSADRDGESLQEVSVQAEQEDQENQEDAKEAADGAGADGEDPAAADGEQQTEGTICVFVCGQVASPGVYELESGSRIYQALEAAGGMLETASATWVNQAEVLTDGQQVYIPTIEEAESGTLAASAGASAGAGEASGGADGAEMKVNLNTADREELMTLTGIGEAKAEAIIQYRTENGAFQSAEELMQVDGIKEGTFAKIKDDITV